MDDARRRPGEYFLGKLMRRDLPLAMVAFMATGFTFGVVVVPLLGQTWSLVLAALAAAGLFAILFRYRRRGEWSDRQKCRIHGLTMAIVVNLDVMLARRKMRAKDLAAAIGIAAQSLSILEDRQSPSAPILDA